ncbi:MAG: hypothetical protein ACI4OW_02185 [Alphaproteobacteria bacterium]
MKNNSVNLGDIIAEAFCGKGKTPNAEKINEFFEEMFPAAREKWPFNFEKEGYTVKYDKAEFLYTQCGLVKNLDLTINVGNEKEGFVISTLMTLDDEVLNIKIDSLCRTRGTKNSNFGNMVISKMKQFIDAQDKSRGKIFEASRILLDAASGLDKNNINVYGGYIWAYNGLDFANEQELSSTRQRFREFAKKSGVEFSTKDLSLFRKPCHFAAFDCGIKISLPSGKNAALGKAFLLSHSWLGKLVASPKKSECPEEQRYAEAFNNPDFSVPKRRRMALEVLSSSYRNMLKKFRRKYSEIKKISKTETYLKIAKMKLAKMLDRF